VAAEEAHLAALSLARLAALVAGVVIVPKAEAQEHLAKAMLAVMVAPEVQCFPLVAVVALAQQVRRAKPKSAALVALDWIGSHLEPSALAVAVAVTLLALAGQPQAAQAAVELAARTAQVWLLAQLIRAAVVVDTATALLQAQQVAPASSSFATQAHSAAQAARWLRLAATPSTPSHRPAPSRHKEKTWHILQK